MKNQIKAIAKNIIGAKTNRKLVAFYVDDYGSTRTRNKEAVDYLVSKGVPNSRYFVDTLASEEDLKMLFEVLESVKDKHGNGACFTAVMNPANPDFEKIKATNYQYYYFEPFTDTLKRYGHGFENAFELWKLGISKNIFYPMFHGAEHISRKRLMNALQTGHEPTRWAFECETVGIPAVAGHDRINGMMQPYVMDHKSDLSMLENQIKDGLKLFETIFGFKARQFRAGGDIVSPDLYPTLKAGGIEYIDETLYAVRHKGDGVYEKSFNYIGKKNKYGQKLMVRNCVFEPTSDLNRDWVNNTLLDIQMAFLCGKPAIISSHRANYVGSISQINREHGLGELNKLLTKLVEKWPDVEFVNADQLADIMYKK